jgi:hypothetical protein
MSEHMVRADAVTPGDFVVDNSGIGEFVSATETVGEGRYAEVVLHSDAGDALIVGTEQLVTVEKP